MRSLEDGDKELQPGESSSMKTDTDNTAQQEQSEPELQHQQVTGTTSSTMDNYAGKTSMRRKQDEHVDQQPHFDIHGPPYDVDFMATAWHQQQRQPWPYGLVPSCNYSTPPGAAPAGCSYYHLTPAMLHQAWSVYCVANTGGPVGQAHQTGFFPQNYFQSGSTIKEPDCSRPSRAAGPPAFPEQQGPSRATGPAAFPKQQQIYRRGDHRSGSQYPQYPCFSSAQAPANANYFCRREEQEQLQPQFGHQEQNHHNSQELQLPKSNRIKQRGISIPQKPAPGTVMGHHFSSDHSRKRDLDHLPQHEMEYRQHDKQRLSRGPYLHHPAVDHQHYPRPAAQHQRDVFEPDYKLQVTLWKGASNWDVPPGDVDRRSKSTCCGKGGQGSVFCCTQTATFWKKIERKYFDPSTNGFTNIRPQRATTSAACSSLCWSSYGEDEEGEESGCENSSSTQEFVSDLREPCLSACKRVPFIDDKARELCNRELKILQALQIQPPAGDDDDDDEGTSMAKAGTSTGKNALKHHDTDDESLRTPERADHKDPNKPGFCSGTGTMYNTSAQRFILEFDKSEADRLAKTSACELFYAELERRKRVQELKLEKQISEAEQRSEKKGPQGSHHVLAASCFCREKERRDSAKLFLQLLGYMVQDVGITSSSSGGHLDLIVERCLGASLHEQLAKSSYFTGRPDPKKDNPGRLAKSSYFTGRPDPKKSRHRGLNHEHDTEAEAQEMRQHAELIVVKILKKILTAVDYLHTEKHYAHRDLKPANMMFRNEHALSGAHAHAKDVYLDPDTIDFCLIDFGLSKQTPKTNEDRYRGCHGTQGYFAPECMYGREHADERMDEFAVGVVFYQMLFQYYNPYGIALPPEVEKTTGPGSASTPPCSSTSQLGKSDTAEGERERELWQEALLQALKKYRASRPARRSANKVHHHGQLYTQVDEHRKKHQTPLNPEDLRYELFPTRDQRSAQHLHFNRGPGRDQAAAQPQEKAGCGKVERQNNVHMWRDWYEPALEYLGCKMEKLYHQNLSRHDEMPLANSLAKSGSLMKKQDSFSSTKASESRTSSSSSSTARTICSPTPGHNISRIKNKPLDHLIKPQQLREEDDLILPIKNASSTKAAAWPPTGTSLRASDRRVLQHEKKVWKDIENETTVAAVGPAGAGPGMIFHSPFLSKKDVVLQKEALVHERDGSHSDVHVGRTKNTTANCPSTSSTASLGLWKMKNPLLSHTLREDMGHRVDTLNFPDLQFPEFAETLLFGLLAPFPDARLRARDALSIVLEWEEALLRKFGMMEQDHETAREKAWST
ncbi:unnamed protein product [Amoebophrya sp. A120]|nr:unnamed protein product [Amoebophrya sp. A120]|eukprot:GSA120T00010553001.1